MVELLSGFPLFIQQLKALLNKNLILTLRNKRSAILQLFSSFFLLLIMFCSDKALHLLADETISGNILDPPALVGTEIPACEERFVLKKPCYDFLWSGNGSPRIEKVVSAIMRNNPGRPISGDRVKSFKTPKEVDAWLFSNPMHCAGALHFVERSSTVISYGIQTNSSTDTRRGKDKDPTMQLQIPLQVAAEREIARSLIGDPNFSWTIGLKAFAQQAGKSSSVFEINATSILLAMAMFGFVFQIGSLVTEKELKLRQAMSMMGLYESAYWLSWLAWEVTLMLISAFLTVIFGMMFRFEFFRHNSFAILFLLFFLFQLSMVGFAFMLSTILSKSSSASTIGFLIFLAGFVCQYFDVYEMVKKKIYIVLWSLFPPNLLNKAVSLINAAMETPEGKGISWRKRGECASEVCQITFEGILIRLILTFFFWFILAIYLDNIIPNSNGVRKSVFYFLTPSYWTGKGSNKVEEGSLFSCMESVPSMEDVIPDDEDVLAEETTVRRKASEDEIDQDIAVQIRGLAKTYPGTVNIGCCKLRRTAAFHAVKGIWVNLPKNQLFCLLGPNGAGKTTAISCLTGITPVTRGDALIYGYSIRNSVGMSNIRKIIGVCPQFDILWDELSGEEHLHLFSSIKGLPTSAIKSAAKKSLAEVKLTSASQVRSGSYSGGMKRRLSVAIALIGDPKLVFLDEPTTGMDPISRRHVWDIIDEAKKGRAIVLTTHSMEEADILSDRIAIMAKGRLRCIGTSIRLKSRFGTGYVATVSIPGKTPTETSENSNVESQAEPVKQFFKNHLNVEPKEENSKFLTFVIPHEKEKLLTSFFTELQDREKELGISDIQIGLTTLEEVFLNIANKAEIESSAAEGNLVDLNLPSGSIKIPKGARFVAIPESQSFENPKGLMVEVYWEHDDDAELFISGHSDETPIPSTVQFLKKPVTPENAIGSAVPVGFAIDPCQIITAGLQ